MSEPLGYRPSQSAVYYQPPGQFHAARLSLGIIISLVAIILGSSAYALIEPKLLNIFARLGASICAGVVLGLFTLLPIRVGRVRTPAIASVVGSLLGIFALYVIWLVWLHNALLYWNLNISIWRLLTHPVVEFRLIHLVNTLGPWNLHGEPVRGVLLFIYWIGEAGIILAGAVAFPILGLFSSDPICHECGVLCKRASNLPRFFVDCQDEFIGAIDNRNYQLLKEFHAPAHSDHPEISLRLMSCPSCGNLNVLTVNRIEWVRIKGGGRRVKFTPLIDQMLITAEECGELKELCSQIQRQRESADA